MAVSVNGRRTRGLTAVACAACAIFATGVAGAHDSLAPPGSTHNWLPHEMWVHRHWVPFGEEQLKHELGLHGRDLHAYLYDDHRTLAMLARARGVDVDELADRLVASWRDIDPAQRAVLRERTIRVLTQGHLAQHVFFHVFHGLDLDRFAPGMFGMAATHTMMLRAQGRSWIEVLDRGGVPAQTFRTVFRGVLEADARSGVAMHEAWPAQADLIVARTLAWMPCWMTRPAPRLDKANPYGKNRMLHGAHSASWPATARERREDERRVERFRARLPKSCWSRPPAWSSTATAARRQTGMAQTRDQRRPNRSSVTALGARAEPRLP